MLAHSKIKIYPEQDDIVLPVLSRTDAKVDNENFLSEASRNHLVLKAQQAKRYSNVTVSC